jgi:8-oxo-dGTP pyrophosphatase MutT (NUDIX family)
MAADIRQLESRVVYENNWMTVREDVVEFPDGSTGIYGVVHKIDFAAVLPRENGGFWIVEQFRYPLGRRSWEFPMGGWPGEPEGDQYALARAELAEETGLRADRLERIGYIAQAVGYGTTGCDVFVATGLTQGTSALEHTEQDLVRRFVTDAELAEMIAAGEIVDSITLAMLTLYRAAGAGAADGVDEG